MGSLYWNAGSPASESTLITTREHSQPLIKQVMGHDRAKHVLLCPCLRAFVFAVPSVWRLFFHFFTSVQRVTSSESFCQTNRFIQIVILAPLFSALLFFFRTWFYLYFYYIITCLFYFSSAMSVPWRKTLSSSWLYHPEPRALGAWMELVKFCGINGYMLVLSGDFCPS